MNLTAQVKNIKPFSNKMNVFIISKIMEITSFSQAEIQKSEKSSIVKKRVRRVKNSKQKKEKNTGIQQSQSDSESQFIPETGQSKRASETKNISTSYGRMILRFIENQKQNIKRFLLDNNEEIEDFNKIINHFSRHMFSVSDLRKLWQDGQNKYSRILRIFSMNFLRKHSLQYIFNSRIKIYERNLKYRHKIIQGVKNPSHFNMLKDY